MVLSVLLVSLFFSLYPSLPFVSLSLSLCAGLSFLYGISSSYRLSSLCLPLYVCVFVCLSFCLPVGLSMYLPVWSVLQIFGLSFSLRVPNIAILRFSLVISLYLYKYNDTTKIQNSLSQRKLGMQHHQTTSQYYITGSLTSFSLKII